MENLIKEIIKSKKEVVFFSAHFDDAALSCSELISILTKRNIKVTVVNCFTNAHKGPYTFSGKKFLKISGDYMDATVFYRDREEEDRKALEFLGVKRIINLSLEDGLFRRNKNSNFIGKLIPEFSHIYPFFKFFITGNILKSDFAQKDLIKKIRTQKFRNSYIFAPLAIGNHVDHQITRNSVEKIFKEIIYYSDFPYNTKKQIKIPKNFKKHEHNVNIFQKEKMLKIYKTQFIGLFPNGKIPKHKEIYYIK